MQVLIKLGHHLAGFESAPIGRQPFQPAGHHAHQRQVFVDHRQHVRAQHLDRDLPFAPVAVNQYREMHLRDRRAGHGFPIKTGEHRADRAAQGFFNGCSGQVGIKWRHRILQFGQFIGDIQRQQIPPGGENLTELDKNRAQALQSLANALTPRRAEVAAPGKTAGKPLQPGLLKTTQKQYVEPEAQKDPDDENAPKKARHLLLPKAPKPRAAKLRKTATEATAA